MPKTIGITNGEIVALKKGAPTEIFFKKASVNRGYIVPRRTVPVIVNIKILFREIAPLGKEDVYYFDRYIYVNFYIKECHQHQK